MTDVEIEALFERSRSNLDSLSIDEIGVPFLVTRDRIRLNEARLHPVGGGKPRRK